MNRRTRVLITGAAGYVGRHLVAGLETTHELCLGDLYPLEDARWRRLDVTRLEDVVLAAQGMDAIIHLAVASGKEGDFEDDHFNQLRFDVNVKGTWNVLEAARRAKVPRVVATSSIMVVWGYPPPQWVPSDAPPRPVGTYALTKMLAENICAYQAAAHGMSIVVLRIAKPIDAADPVWRGRRIRPQWIAFPELVEAYRCALAAPDIGFEIVTLVGDSSRRRWDLEKAARVLGYRPAIRLEDLGFVLGEENEPF